MFWKNKYTVTLLNPDWKIIKQNVSLNMIPNVSEYIYINNQYYNLINIIHDLRKTHKILLIVEEISQKKLLL